MSGYYDPAPDGSAGQMPQYPVYDNQYNTQYHRLGGPSSHYDGVAFWYRPEAQEPIYEHDASLYNNGVGVQPATMEAPNIQKHRRTRSGCYTCRQRRVKVSLLFLDKLPALMNSVV